MYINDTCVDGRRAPYNSLIRYNHSGCDGVRLIEYQPGKYRFFAFVAGRDMDASLEDIPLDIIKAVEADNPNLIIYHGLYPVRYTPLSDVT